MLQLHARVHVLCFAPQIWLHNLGKISKEYLIKVINLVIIPGNLISVLKQNRWTKLGLWSNWVLIFRTTPDKIILKALTQGNFYVLVICCPSRYQSFLLRTKIRKFWVIFMSYRLNSIQYSFLTSTNVCLVMVKWSLLLSTVEKIGRCVFHLYHFIVTWLWAFKNFKNDCVPLIFLQVFDVSCYNLVGSIKPPNPALVHVDSVPDYVYK